MSIFVVDTGAAPSGRSIAEIEADITALLTAAPETDFAFLLKTNSGVYQFEKGTQTIETGISWNSASKMLQASCASYQIKKGVLAATDTIASIVELYRTAFPGAGVVSYTGDATIQDALNFSTGYATQCRNAGDPANTNIPQPDAWMQCVPNIPNIETQSAPAGTDGSAEYSTGHQDQYGVPILMELLRTGATYWNGTANVPYVDWRDVWKDFIVNEFTTLSGSQIGTTYFTSSDTIKNCTISQYMAVLEAWDDPSTSTDFLTKEMRDSYFTDNNSYQTTPIPGGPSDPAWFGIDVHQNGYTGWIRPPGDEDEGDVETSGLGGQFTKISRRDSFKLAFGTVATSGVIQVPGGFTIYTRNGGAMRALVRERASFT